MRWAALLLLVAGMAQAQEPNLVQDGRAVVVGAMLEGPGEPNAVACFSCHGLDGAGDSAGAFPRLAGQSSWYLYKALKDYASGTRPNDIMTPIARALSDHEMQAVAAYYAAVTDAPYAAAPAADPLLLQRGGALSAIGSAERAIQACVNCHGPEGIGLPPSFPYLAGQHAAYIALQLQLFRQEVRRSDPLGVMTMIAKAMTEEDVEAVAQYFASLRGAPP